MPVDLQGSVSAIRVNSILWKMTRTWGHFLRWPGVTYSLEGQSSRNPEILCRVLPGLLFSNRFSRAIKYEIESHVLENIPVIPANLNIHGYSVDLGMCSRDNCSELGRLSGDSGDFAIHTELEHAVLIRLIVLFQSQGNSLYVSCSHHSFSSLDTGRWEDLLKWVSRMNFH